MDNQGHVQEDARKIRERDYHDRAFSENTRDDAGKFYAIANGLKKEYAHRLGMECAGKRLLEYGCGPGGVSLSLAAAGVQTTGIDISGVAIEKARAAAAERNIGHASYEVMDAEKLAYEDSRYDMICGTSILHHLSLERAFDEIARVLAPGGFALFIEPLGHNPLINLYRKRTPALRTSDEHPLVMGDVKKRRGGFSPRSRWNIISCLRLTQCP